MDKNPMRPAGKNDFTIPVEGVGTFTFGYRKMEDEMKIAAEFSKICGGVETPNAFLRTVGDWIATFRVLTVAAPAGWDLEEMDPLDDATYSRMFLVYAALRDKERSFRGKPGAASQGTGAAVGQEPAVLVSPEVQPTPYGPAVS